MGTLLGLSHIGGRPMSLREDGYLPGMGKLIPLSCFPEASRVLALAEVDIAIDTLNGGGVVETALIALGFAKDALESGSAASFDFIEFAEALGPPRRNMFGVIIPPS